MKISSCKSKARRLQNDVAALIREATGMGVSDIHPTIMGEGGMDIHLSSGARRVFPWAVECKAQEALGIWDALNQAACNASYEGLPPLLVFKRNRSDTYATMRFDDFLALVQRANGRKIND